jgi:hypothetical protein
MRFSPLHTLSFRLLTLLSLAGVFIYSGLARAYDFEPEDPLKGLTKPVLNWPTLPPPLPTDTVAFCTQQEELTYRNVTLKPVMDKVFDVFRLASNYDGAVDGRYMTAKNVLNNLKEKQKDIPGAVDAEEIATWEKAVATLKTAKADAETFLAEAQKKKDSYIKVDDQVFNAKIVQCLCDEVGMPKGLVLTQVDERGKPHLPGKDYDYTHNKPTDAGYYSLRMTVKPEIGSCFKGEDGKTHISFPLYGGSTIVPQYFDWKVLGGEMPKFWYPEQMFKSMRITYDNGVAVDRDGYADGGAVPDGAKAVKKVELFMDNGGYDADGKATTTKLEWSGQ